MTTTKRSPAGKAHEPTVNHQTTPASRPIAPEVAPFTFSKLLDLTVTHPATGVCVVTVNGELDALTAPLLDTCIREQLATTPAHLILDLQPVRFLGSSGLTCLLEAREHVQQTPGVQLHLAGLITRIVARPLQVTELLELFDTHPTLTDALAALPS